MRGVLDIVVEGVDVIAVVLAVVVVDVAVDELETAAAVAVVVNTTVAVHTVLVFVVELEPAFVAPTPFLYPAPVLSLFLVLYEFPSSNLIEIAIEKRL